MQHQIELGKEWKDEENNCHTRKILRIFDALNEKIIVDGWESIKRFGDYYDLTALKSPIDGKLHLFDRYAYRKSTNSLICISYSKT